jgi:hypothetical protein
LLETWLDVKSTSLTAFNHSGFGEGFKMEKHQLFVFNKVDQQQDLPKSSRDLGSHILEFVIGKKPKKKGNKKKWEVIEVILQKLDHPLVGPIGRYIAMFVPACINLDTTKRNPKANLPSKRTSPPGEEKNHPDQQKR